MAQFDALLDLKIPVQVVGPVVIMGGDDERWLSAAADYCYSYNTANYTIPYNDFAYSNIGIS